MGPEQRAHWQLSGWPTGCCQPGPADGTPALAEVFMLLMPHSPASSTVHATWKCMQLAPRPLPQWSMPTGRMSALLLTTSLRLSFPVPCCVVLCSVMCCAVLCCACVLQADVAVLVISSRKGEYETGFEKGGQTREHAQVRTHAETQHKPATYIAVCDAYDSSSSNG